MNIFTLPQSIIPSVQHHLLLYLPCLQHCYHMYHHLVSIPPTTKEANIKITFLLECTGIN